MEGASAFSSSFNGQPSYVELTSLPMFDEAESDPLDSDEGRKLLGRVRRDGAPMAVVVVLHSA